MADSYITKKALASALKELMEEAPFEKISVAHICEKCDMNRKSFYYHFKDKYDLINWIYDTEFIAVVRKKPLHLPWDFLSDLCEYLYENRSFYRKALAIKGQNSFSNHFREMLLPLLAESVRDLLLGEELQEFHVNFFADGFMCAMERWLLDKDCAQPEKFLSLLKSCLEQTAIKVYQDMNLTE